MLWFGDFFVSPWFFVLFWFFGVFVSLVGWFWFFKIIFSGFGLVVVVVVLVWGEISLEGRERQLVITFSQTTSNFLNTILKCHKMVFCLG